MYHDRGKPDNTNAYYPEYPGGPPADRINRIVVI
jgi:hypothetical protein